MRTETFDTGCDVQTAEQLASMVLTEKGGKTLMTLTVLFKSKEDRDAAIASGMDQGAGAGYDRLEQLLAEMR